jgi:hypothetical protein
MDVRAINIDPEILGGTPVFLEQEYRLRICLTTWKQENPFNLSLTILMGFVKSRSLRY